MLRVGSLLKTAIRLNHKGFEGTPPMRHFSVTKDICLYLGLSFACLSYPTYVLLNLDNMLRREDRSLSAEVQEELDRRASARSNY